ncbi:GNAT family N-acetyltransferase [Oryzobacter terrae]|uniref:GNAT family N-acetyltransferase n=1 Tax=Oryzobacter terrae TaxID=1620385 RepID=UPI00366CB469
MDAANRDAVAALTVTVEQSRFVASPTHYLTLCAAEGVWHPLAVYEHDAVVGFLMWAVDEDDASCWLGGVIIDARHQGRGLGRAAVIAVLDVLTDHATSAGFALSYEPDNHSAAGLYRALGFVETGEQVDGEVVARLRR